MNVKTKVELKMETERPFYKTDFRQIFVGLQLTFISVLHPTQLSSTLIPILI